VKVGVIDLEGLERNRDQLFAEAAHAEEQDESLGLPPELYGTAAVEQEARTVSDPWKDALAEVNGEVVGGMAQVSSQRLLQVLGIQMGNATNQTYRRLAASMKKLGWQREKLWFPASSTASGSAAQPATVRSWGYWRPAAVQ
jgi:predicted P-loop ATPase